MKSLQPLFDKLDHRTPRERLFLLVAAIAVLFFLWDSLLAKPFLARKKRMEAQAVQTTERVEDLRRQIDQIIAQHNRDPDRENRERQVLLQEENQRLDQRLEAMADAFISPHDMAQALEDLLNKQNGLRLLEMTNLPPEPLLTQKSGDPGSVRPDTEQLMVYRHPLVLRYEGSFDETLKFVRQVENLPHLLFWQNLEFKVLDHPRARISITVFTLSLQKGWIGA